MSLLVKKLDLWQPLSLPEEQFYMFIVLSPMPVSQVSNECVSSELECSPPFPLYCVFFLILNNLVHRKLQFAMCISTPFLLCGVLVRWKHFIPGCIRPWLVPRTSWLIDLSRVKLWILSEVKSNALDSLSLIVWKTSIRLVYRCSVGFECVCTWNNIFIL